MNMYLRYLGCFLVLFSTLATGQTQSDLTTGKCNENQKAERKLTETYEKALKLNEGDRKLVIAIKQSQAAWQSYVQAQMSAIYPEDYKGGSAETMCRCGEQLELINTRIDQLSRWVYVQQGDLCAGSRSS
jgi:uncharacterized protein YecT (DUF1311 family)